MLAAFFNGWWEIVLILAVLLILFSAKNFPDRAERLRRELQEFRKSFRTTLEDDEPGTTDPENDATDADNRPRSREDELVLWLAQGFDVGRIPVAPGTLGSLVGVLWFAILLVPGNLWFYVAGTALGLALSVWLCGAAEKILREKDPGRIVLDEIVAMPICFLPWVLSDCARLKAMPAVEAFFTERAWIGTTLLFVLFRVFDVLKPWPVRQSQKLPGGWGVTADDLLAAAYVALLSVLFLG